MAAQLMKNTLAGVAMAMLVLAMTPGAAVAQKKAAQPPLKFAGARSEVYKTIGDVALQMYIFEPAGHKAADRRPAVVFFFGGGWKGGTPKQFEHQCRYLASRGMVAMTADYRVSSRHGTKAIQCVTDGKSAVRWVRENAKRLGIDPARIAAGGGSAGGHVAACTGVVPGLEASSENKAVSSRPNALVLFNPALVLAPIGDYSPFDAKRMAAMPARVGADPEVISPYHHIAAGQPPTLILHGKADTTVAYKTAELFAEKTKETGNACELIGYEGAQHGFFNHGRGDGSAYVKTTQALDRFLTKLGYLQGPPTIE